MPPTLPNNPIVLEVKGLHIPSFKNSKLLARNRKNGKVRPITKPEFQEQMERIEIDFVSQFCSVIRIIEGGTLTAPRLAYWTALSLPQDDSRQWIPELHVLTEEVAPGNEGARITIERLS